MQSVHAKLEVMVSNGTEERTIAPVDTIPRVGDAAQHKEEAGCNASEQSYAGGAKGAVKGDERELSSG
jgi:hypothetical protein